MRKIFLTCVAISCLWNLPSAMAACVDGKPLVESPFPDQKNQGNCPAESEQKNPTPSIPAMPNEMAPKRMMGLLLGVGDRGVISESGNFWEKLNAEAGLWANIPFSFDLSFAIGQMFESGASLSRAVQARVWPMTFWREEDELHTKGIYLGAGRLWSDERTLNYGILGFGRVVFLEAQFRDSDVRPIAAILNFGIRLRY